MREDREKKQGTRKKMIKIAKQQILERRKKI
jgi:hypothetical protein